jgi:hypothetical protein
MTTTSPRRCLCGHGPGAHEHYRGGTDCAWCGCPRWRTRVPLGGWLFLLSALWAYSRKPKPYRSPLL